MRGFRPRIFRPRMKRPRSARRWTAQVGDGLTLSTTALGTSTLVAVSDYQGNTNLEPEGPTLVRIRGYITVTATVATAFSYWMGLWVGDVDSGAGLAAHGDPGTVQNLIDDDWLWWTSGRAEARTLLTAPYYVDRYEVDIKSKRRLKDQQVILSWVASNAGAAGTQGAVTLNLRALLVGNSAT